MFHRPLSAPPLHMLGEYEDSGEFCMFQSSNGQSLDSVELETIRAWYTMGYLEGMLAGYTSTEPAELDNILLQPHLFIPLVKGLDQAQRRTLLETFNSINFEAVGGGSGEFQKARMAKFWHYLGGLH